MDSKIHERYVIVGNYRLTEDLQVSLAHFRRRWKTSIWSTLVGLTDTQSLCMVYFQLKNKTINITYTLFSKNLKVHSSHSIENFIRTISSYLIGWKCLRNSFCFNKRNKKKCDCCPDSFLNTGLLRLFD